MSRAKSPRAAKRVLGFDKEKIREFGKRCRAARQYFYGGKPSESLDASEDPAYQSSWNLIMQDCSTQIGVPISTISEIENHAAYTIGLDSAMSLAVFLWLNSKNGHLLDGWMAPEHLLMLDETFVKKNEASGFKPISLDVLASTRQFSALSVDDSQGASPFIPSKEFVLAVEFLLSDWARLTESSINSAVKASKLPSSELDQLRTLVGI